MEAYCALRVAVLLATYNGSTFVESQIRSLAHNKTPFTLHWLDDHSTDSTRNVVRSASTMAGIPLVEWHTDSRLRAPGTYFRLLQLVEADIYLFCDQDDVWLAGKIDAITQDLSKDVSSRVLCFSDTLLFYPEDLPRSKRLFQLFQSVGRFESDRLSGVQMMLEALSPSISAGHTQGFTRPLRDLVLSHIEIANEHAYMHDWWLHDVALASGVVRLFSPDYTVIWRQHQASFSGRMIASGRGKFGLNRIHVTQTHRSRMAKHARGFVLAAPTMPTNRHWHQLFEIALLLSDIDRRQSLRSILRILRIRPRRRLRWLFIAACLCSNAPRL